MVMKNKMCCCSSMNQSSFRIGFFRIGVRWQCAATGSCMTKLWNEMKMTDGSLARKSSCFYFRDYITS